MNKHEEVPDVGNDKSYFFQTLEIRRRGRVTGALLTLLLAAPAFGWQAWDDRELFSTPDGRVQYIELYSPTNNQNALGTRELRSVSADGLHTNSYTFPGDAPVSSSNKTWLVATPGFATLPGGVQPDATNLPPGFLFTSGGSFWLVGGTATQSYGPGVLPLDGVSSLATPGLTTNRASPRNVNGTERNVVVAVPGSGRVLYDGLYHHRPHGTVTNPTLEALPHDAFATNTFLEVQYERTNVNFHFLTAAPAADNDVQARVRLFPVGPNGMAEQFAPAAWVTNIQLTATNRFHGTPAGEFMSVSNSLRNPGFETNGVWWTPFGHAGYSNQAARSGGFGAVLGDFTGYNGTYYALSLRVTPGREYRWSAWLRKEAGYTADGTWLKVEWKDAQTQDLSFVDVDLNGVLTTNWQEFALVVTSPANAVLARPTLLNLGSGSGGNFAAADDVVFTNLPPVTETNVVALWRASWVPPRAFTGTVYYAPQILNYSNDVLVDHQYLLFTVGPNVGSTNFGINDYFWKSDAQAFGRDYFNLDYSFVWTNPAPFNFDGVYFNSTNSGLPQNEAVPGLPGRTFLEWNYGPGGLSHLHVLAGAGELTALTTRFDFVAGGGEFFRTGAMVTTVVVDAGAPFHGWPAAGAVTLDVWRVDFYPPPGWSGQPVYYGHAIGTPLQGGTWLVSSFANAVDGTGLTNGLVPPQYFYTGGPYDRDWSYTPTQAVTRNGVGADFLYHNHTNRNPRVEQAPGLVGAPFLHVDYARTTTVFRVMTESPANVQPGEGLLVQVRIDYNHPVNGFSPQFYNMVFDHNAVLPAGSFHGAPASGSRTVDVWRYDWAQPVDGGNVPYTNVMTVYYAPFLRTTMGAQNYETGYRYLVAQDGETNGFPVDPQVSAAAPENRDYAYEHKYPADSDGDGLPDWWEREQFASLAQTATNDPDGDGVINEGEFAGGTLATNGASWFGELDAVGAPGAQSTLQVGPTRFDRAYQVYVTTNLTGAQVWQPAGVEREGNGGTLNLIVTNSSEVRLYRAGARAP
jgi:hypothetical protein